MAQPAGSGAGYNRDLWSWLRPKASLVSKAYTTTTNGLDVNLKYYEGVCFFVESGAYTDGTHTISCQEAPDSAGSPGAYATITNLQGTAPVISAAGNASKNWRFAPQGGITGSGVTSPQWVRAVSTISAATTGALYSVTVVRGWPRVLPEPDPGSAGDAN